MKRIGLAGRVFGFALIVGAASLGLPHHGAAAPPGALKALDTDNDGTVDLAEAKAAASMLFDKLDRDHDGTLDRRELRGRMVSKEFGAADGDRDGTLDKDEYLASVEKSFRAADRDNDGTLDAKELGSARGRALLRLLR
jgi:Ca2+-binding EF-hand superfamily protein